MSTTHTPGYESITKYINQKRLVWAETTCHTAHAKLNRMFRLQALHPMRLLKELRVERLSNYTIQVYFELWKGYERFCYDGKSPTHDFMIQNRGLFKNAYENKTYRMTMKEYKDLLEEASTMGDGLYNLILLFGAAGLRLSEGLNAKWEDLGADGQLRVVGKGGKVRLVPLPVMQFIQTESKFIAGDKPAVRKLLSNKKYTAHDIRAFFATQVATAVSPYELMDLLGHEDFNTTMKYIRRNPTIIRSKLHEHYGSIQKPNRSAHPSDSKQGEGS